MHQCMVSQKLFIQMLWWFRIYKDNEDFTSLKFLKFYAINNWGNRYQKEVQWHKLISHSYVKSKTARFFVFRQKNPKKHLSTAILGREWWLVDFLCKESLMQQAFSHHGIIIDNPSSEVHRGHTDCVWFTQWLARIALWLVQSVWYPSLESVSSTKSYSCVYGCRGLAVKSVTNTLRLGWHFSDDMFKYVFLNENYCILNQILLKFVLYDPIDSLSALIQIMAQHQWGDKPLPEAFMAVVWCHISSSACSYPTIRKKFTLTSQACSGNFQP